MNQYALILAGGSGTRFWPLSRDHRPKQLLNIIGEDTLLRQAIDRLDGLVPRQNIFILTNHLQEAEVRRQAPDIPRTTSYPNPSAVTRLPPSPWASDSSRRRTRTASCWSSRPTSSFRTGKLSAP